MKSNNNFSLLVQVGINDRIFANNKQEAWQIYGGNPSFRSHISGNVLIMDHNFYDQMPQHMKHIPCTEIMLTNTLASIIQNLERKPDKKYYIAGSPALFFQAIQKSFERHITEMISMRTDTHADSGVIFDLKKKFWDKKLLCTIPHDRHQLLEVTFDLWTKKNE